MNACIGNHGTRSLSFPFLLTMLGALLYNKKEKGEGENNPKMPGSACSAIKSIHL